MPISKIIDYCALLKSIGFSNSLRENPLTTGTARGGYEFYGEKSGSCVNLTDDGRGCMIMVIVQN